MDLPDMDVIMASAARFLIDGNEHDAAMVLLACALDIRDTGEGWWSNGERVYGFHLELTGPRFAFDVLTDDANELGRRVFAAINAVLPWEIVVTHQTARAELIEIDPDWRGGLQEIARGREVNNQGVSYRANNQVQTITWKNLKFRSRSEARIAAALDEAGVLFLPNCLARVGQGSTRENREPDFLVCYKQKWGILEVDGEPFHPPARTTQEQERDRLFKVNGIRVVEHFDASRCYQEPRQVVREFLSLLDGNG